ncbi:MAG TPA: carbamoyltransferase HypF, partial [Polyangiaceae bacterium]
PARVQTLERAELPELPADTDFHIAASANAEVLPALPADLAPCAECLREVGAATGRRSGYPFTACAQCGSRYSIVQALPYDRAGTTLREFPLCAECTAEYGSPNDRRFHAQAIACPRCGPTLELLDAQGARVERGSRALERATALLRDGQILALRGVGGFQLLVDACDTDAVMRLRARKRREEKPFAVLFPDLEAAENHAQLRAGERELLTGPEAPIVIVKLRAGALPAIATAVAPGSPELGCLLPASPLHRLLALAVGRPLVCTSGNSSGEPLCTETDEAIQRLRGIADAFLSHDRAIARPLDDSVARVGPRGPSLLRRARGYAPRVVAELGGERTVLSLGAELKAAPSLLLSGSLVLGQHVGDLGELATLRAFERNVRDLLCFFAAMPCVIACDLHPDFGSTRLAERLSRELDVPILRVQHHHAHVAAVIAEHGIAGPVLGFAWDGIGLGSDGTIWGGEALIVERARARRVAHLPAFRLPGGDSAAREPWRSALGLLHAIDPALAREHGQRWLPAKSLALALQALERGVNAPLSSSVGRLFDAVSALAGSFERVNFEGQAAIALELAAGAHADDEPYPLDFAWLGSSEPSTATGQAPQAHDAHGLAPFTRALLDDVARGTDLPRIARRLHAALVAAAVRVASKVGLHNVALTGGCFQNGLLSAELTRALEARGHTVYGAAQVPCNDGGISAGQAAIAAWA